jgi:hypothetical protein
MRSIHEDSRSRRGDPVWRRRFSRLITSRIAFTEGFLEMNNVRTRRRDFSRPHTTDRTRICMDTGLVNFMHAKDSGGPIVLWETRRKYERIRLDDGSRLRAVGKHRQGMALTRLRVTSRGFKCLLSEECDQHDRRTVTTGGATRSGDDDPRCRPPLENPERIAFVKFPYPAANQI